LVTFIRHPRARRYLLRLNRDGSVRVTIPRGGSRREADAFLARQQAWLEQQRARLRPSALSAEERQALRTRAEAELPARLLALAADHGLTVTRISIRNQRTRWGSCGRNGHITLNWRLISMPDWVRDYVLLHELMHLRRLDHSLAYWKLVAAVCPRHREARRWLRLHGDPLR
jgi:hypothetical protein